jgi:hypothetical protein
MLKRRLLFCFPVSFIFIFNSCNNKTDEEKLLGVYQLTEHVKNAMPGMTDASYPADWKLSLEKDDNFQIYGSKKNSTGYWKIESKENNGYVLSMHYGNNSSFVKAENGSITFNSTDALLDSLFKTATFKRVKK